MSVEMFQQRPAQGRLARADLAGELHKALALADAIEQMIERLAMLGAVKQEARVRRDVERRLLQSIKLQIHARLLTETCGRWKRKKIYKVAVQYYFLCMAGREG